MPVEILGLNDVPEAGDILNATDEKTARSVAEKRLEKKRSSELSVKSKVTLDDLFSQIQQGELKELSLIVKGDVQGSVEALSQSLVPIRRLVKRRKRKASTCVHTASFMMRLTM